jgi:hypothetical protein
MGDGLAADGTPGDDATSDGAAMRDGTVTEGAMDSGAADVFEEAPAHCSGDFQCIPAVPGGWAGPTDLYLGAAPAPTCPGLTTDSFDGMEGLHGRFVRLRLRSDQDHLRVRVADHLHRRRLRHRLRDHHAGARGLLCRTERLPGSGGHRHLSDPRRGGDRR